MGDARRERADDQQTAEDERRDVEARGGENGHAGRVAQPVNITVLGKSPAWQDADGACSGYLVRGGGQTVLLDCGPGVFAKLRTQVDYAAVDAVVISHLHADHMLDLVPFASGLRYGPRAARPRLYAPPGALEAFAGMSSATFMTAEHIELAFDVTIYDPADVLEVGGLTVRFQPVPHYIPCQRGRVRGRRRAVHLLRRLRAQPGAVRLRRRAPTCC